MDSKVVVQSLEVRAFTIPTEEPESDGTLEWSKTTMVLVAATAGGTCGLGYTYSSRAAAIIVADVLAPCVAGLDAMEIPRANFRMRRAVRNLGASGLCVAAISAVDNALWDLKAKLLDLPLCVLLGQVRDGVPIYGSGGFTSYSDERLAGQLGGWIAGGIPRVKMKVGRDPSRDPHRLRIAREAIGDADLFVDANSAYDRKQALDCIEMFSSEYDIRWMEQPLPPEDRAGMRMLCEHAPARVEIADGEYADGPASFRHMIETNSVDVVMADATRCGGLSGFLQADALCAANRLPLSSHCAPLQHLHAGCAAPSFRHGEYFHDHVRIERMLFDGMPEPKDGVLFPDPGRPGLGVEFRDADAKKFQVFP
jgi:L-alanine-DL-glutamate epimerase-like enolase superfamily enzyme